VPASVTPRTFVPPALVPIEILYELTHGWPTQFAYIVPPPPVGVY